MKNWRYLAYAVIIGLAIAFPIYSNPYLQHVMITILIFLALALSWDMLLRCGQISFGIAGFFGIGSYTAVLTCSSWKISPLLSIFLGGVIAALIALILGIIILRLRGMYFAIVTLALAEIFRVIVRNWSNFTGGPQGKILLSAIFGGDSTRIYWLILTISILTILLSEFIQRSRLHFAVTSIRNDETLAKSSGIDIFKYLLLVFALTSGIQGIVGAAYAQQYGFVTPGSSFSLDFTLLPLAMSLFGGIYTTLGPIVGAGILGASSEYLRLILPHGHLLIYGIIIVIVIIFLPKGIVGVINKLLRRKVGI